MPPFWHTRSRFRQPYIFNPPQFLDLLTPCRIIFLYVSFTAAGLLPARRRQLPAVPSPPLSLDWLNLSAYGFPDSVALSELPGSKFRGRYRDLITDISTLKSLDISDVVVLITMAEFRKFHVPNLLTEYENSGLLVFHFPIEDGMVPEDVLGLVRKNFLLKKECRMHIHIFHIHYTTAYCSVPKTSHAKGKQARKGFRLPSAM